MAQHSPPRPLYQPLHPARNELRLLELLPAAKTQDEVIHCTLTTHSLHSLPDYAALSYVWGDPDVTHPVVVNGQEVQVTTNLAAALSQLREQGVTTLWVDALCIDQSNNEEKSQQVQKMSLIYQEAGYVVAWLGPADGESAGGIRAMKELARVADVVGLVNLLSPRVGDVPKERKGEVLDMICGVLLDEACGVGEGDVGRVIALMEREYWRRLWILQEISLASSAVLCCGADVVLWTDVEKALAIIKWLRHLSFQQPHAFKAVNPALTALYRPYVLEEWRPPPAAHLSASMSKGARLSLFDVLDQTNDGTVLDCSDPRDRVYALLGLVHESYPDFTAVSYAATYVEVFVRASLSMLLFHGPIALLFAGLSAQQVQDDEFKLPSWAVDWRCTERRAQEMWQFVPDATQEFPLRISDDSLEITVGAASGAGIFAVVPYSQDLRYIFQRFQQIREEHQLERPEGKGPPVRALESMLWHALLYMAEITPCSEEEIVRLFKKCIQSPDTTPSESQPDHQDDQIRENSSEDSRTFEQLLWIQTPLALFITSEGVIGSGPACIQVGDVVHAIPGLELPLLLRADGSSEQQERWKLVGAAYVDDMVQLGESGHFTLDRFWASDPQIREVVLS